MCFEGMEESGSEGLDDLIESRKNDFFSVSTFLSYTFYSANLKLGGLFVENP